NVRLRASSHRYARTRSALAACAAPRAAAALPDADVRPRRAVPRQATGRHAAVRRIVVRQESADSPVAEQTPAAAHRAGAEPEGATGRLAVLRRPGFAGRTPRHRKRAG